MSEDDIRKVIYLDEIQGENPGSGNQEGEDQADKRVEERAKSRYLSESELKSKLESYKGRIPAVVIRDLYDLLKGRRLTEEQVEKIVHNVERKLRDRIEVDVSDIYSKIDRLEKMIEQMAKGLQSGARSTETEKQMQHDRPAETALSEAEKYDVRKSDEREEVVEGVGFEDIVNGRAGGEIVQSHRSEIAGQREMDAAHQAFLAGSAVYLDRIPANTKSMMFLLKWIEYMIERVGYSGLEDVLDYYVDIGWISENVMFDILRYAKGIRLYHESSDWRPVGYMNVQDHIMSLLFIEALKTGRMNKEILHEVERQIYRIKKGVSEINGL